MTRAAFLPDGYFKTGDVGHQDQHGNLFITDRVKELIKYKGFQVAPAELEGLLVTHPKIADVAVIGVYDPSLASEVPRAYVVAFVPTSTSTSTSPPAPSPPVAGATLKARTDPALEREIVQWLESRVANHKRLRGGVRFIDQVPKSAAGKILRKALKALAETETPAAGGLKAKL